VTNAAAGRPIYGDRFNTGNIERALLARGFQYGTQPGALNVGWNGGHTAATLPDGTPVSSGEGGGVKVGGGGAYQKQFTRRMFLPMPVEAPPAPDPLMAPPMDPFPFRDRCRSCCSIGEVLSHNLFGTYCHKRRPASVADRVVS
jgi:hypothetical protein